jgi:tRNA pseudouridine38-40 synthase
MDEITPQEPASPDVRRLRFTVAYEGTPWQGWQGQPNGFGIQNRIEKAMAAVTKEPVSFQAAGRTDTGVHALCQTAHCDVPARLTIPPERWVRAINGGLPPSIRILTCEEAAPDFHARFCAQGKIYRYRIHRSEIMPPLEADRAWHVRGPVNFDLLAQCLAKVKGTHNFARLSANRGFDGEAKLRAIPANTTRTIHSAEFRVTPEGLEIEVAGNGFLYKMVRLIVGACLHVARERDPIDWFNALLDDPTGPKGNQCAPAAGLYLVKVFY